MKTFVLFKKPPPVLRAAVLQQGHARAAGERGIMGIPALHRGEQLHGTECVPLAVVDPDDGILDVQILESLGVGYNPMLAELPGIVRAMREELEWLKARLEDDLK